MSDLNLIGKTRELIISKCELRKVNFDNLTVAKSLCFALFISIEKNKIDSYSLNSLIRFIHSNNLLEIADFIDDWIINEAKKNL